MSRKSIRRALERVVVFGPSRRLYPWSSSQLGSLRHDRLLNPYLPQYIVRMSHRSAIAALKAARAGGRRLDQYQVQDASSIYEEVDEEGYKKVVRSRLNQDDFVVDDNGEGYADDGREEWHTERQHYSSEEDDQPLRGPAAKRKREEDEEKIQKTNHKIANYFNQGQNVSNATKPKVSLRCASSEYPLTGADTNHSRGRSVHGRVTS